MQTGLQTIRGSSMRLVENVMIDRDGSGDRGKYRCGVQKRRTVILKRRYPRSF
jgi:hypothetical protein